VGKKRRKTSGKVRKKRNRSDRQRAKLAYKQGNYDKAILILQSGKDAIDQTQKNAALAELYFRRAHRHETTQPEQALQDFEKAARHQTDDALYAYHVGLAYHRREEPGNAIEWYRESLARDAAFERAYFPLAIALHENGDPVHEEDVWQKITAEQKAYVSDDHPPADTLQRGLKALQQEEFDNAEQLLTAVVDSDDHTPAYRQAIVYDYLGRLTLQRNPDDLEQALVYWQQAYDSGLRSSALLDNLSLAYTLHIEALLAENRVADARKVAQKAIQYFPEHTRLQQIQSHLLLRAGYNAAVEANWQDAINHWTAVENAESEVARRLAANMALVYEKLENWEAAADSWREFARRRGRKEGASNWLSPAQVARLWSRTSNLYMRAGEEDQAITTLKTALKYDPDDLDMGVDLARRYAEADRPEAAHNQIDRTLKKHPDSAKALSFKAELSEIAPQGWGFINHQAINAWKKVLETDDEGYVPVARQSLKNVYLEEYQRAVVWSFSVGTGLSMAEEALELFPDFSEMRANYIGGLLQTGQPIPAIKEQLEKLDFNNTTALQYAISILYYFEENQLAEDTLQQADRQTTLTSEFYSGLSSIFIDREQYDLAATFFEKALQVADNDEERHQVLLAKASAYYDNDYSNEEARDIVKRVLKEDAHFGPAHLLSAMMNLDKGDFKEATWHLKKAEKWATKKDNRDLLAVVRQIRSMMENPPSFFPPGFDPSMLPPGLDIEDFLNEIDMDEDFDGDMF
jgi:tetratricopeptide (TPR) repeat protein